MNIKRMVLGSLNTNCYIIYDDKSKKAAVTDPADNGGKILEFINKNSLTIEYIILTHAHTDHMQALDFLKDNTNAKIVLHTDEREQYYNSTYNLCDYFGIPSPKSDIDIYVNDGDELDLSGNTLKFIHTPGHTKGSMCILTSDALISGDTLFLESIGRTDLYGGDYDAIIASIKEILFSLRDDMPVYPGHGDTTTIGHEKNFNPYI